MADVVLKRHCKLLSFFTIIALNADSEIFRTSLLLLLQGASKAQIWAGTICLIINNSLTDITASLIVAVYRSDKL